VKYLIGIDEAGRGPLAGPVSVGAVIVPHDFDFSLVSGVKDSKMLTPKMRDEWYGKLQQIRDAGNLRFAVCFSSAETIDQEGIVPSIVSALGRVLDELQADPEECEVRLDGGLKAPARFKAQRTIIRGDQTEPVISLAAIAAKVERDRLMMDAAKAYPQYLFDEHKGYGTRAHREIILEHGISPFHRATFCTALRNAANTV